MPVTLDVTDPAQIQAAVESIESLDILINNAGVVLTMTSAIVPRSNSASRSTCTAHRV